MSTDPHSQKTTQAPANNSGTGDGQQQFTPEELRKAARAQVILYVVMAVFVLLPFVVLWLRK